MKNSGIKKLNLEKIRIARLGNLEKIIGGSATEQTNLEVCSKESILCEQSISTKTIGLGYTSACFAG